MKRSVIIIVIICIIVASLTGILLNGRNGIKEVVMTSPRSTAMYDQVLVELQKPAPIYIIYKEVKSGKTYKTRISPKALKHKLDLLLLKANTEYSYQIVIDNLLQQRSKHLKFKTRVQSPWLQNHWHNNLMPHDESALGDGFILFSFGRLPGYMALMDPSGEIRWYWQIEDIGVRNACLTPRGTFLAMLRPFMRDEIDDAVQTHEEISKEENKKPMRRGSIGFAGGTGLAEVSLTGQLMWRLDLNKVEEEKDLHIIHHDTWMDENHHIHTLFRPKKIGTFMEDGKIVTDTLSGDGILVIDSLGEVIKKWSAWQVWDISHDPYISDYRYDRFHANGLCFDKDGNYLVSMPIEDQIWKIDAKSGKLLWRFGRNGDFKMDTTALFSFQHAPIIDADGDLMLFDNGLYNQISGAKAFRLDETARTAKLTIKAMLPKAKYTSRMGSAYLLPNGNLLQTSSKTGSIMVTDKKGKILWESQLYFAPYRAVFVPTSTFSKYFTEIK